MEHQVNLRVKSGNREQESREEEGEQLRLEMQAHLERPCKSRDAVELDPEPLKWFKLGSGMIKCVLLKRPLGLQLQADWIQPKVNFFHLISCNQVQGDGDVLKFWHLVVGAVLEDELIEGQSHGPSLNPAPQHFDPGAQSSGECQRQI